MSVDGEARAHARRRVVRGRRRALVSSSAAAVAAMALVLTVVPGRAWALQPLETFVRQAWRNQVDVQDAIVAVASQVAQRNLALSRVLPGLALKGTYTRNAFEVAFPFEKAAGIAPIQLTIQPRNQLDATVTLDVPLINVGNFTLLSAMGTSAAAVASQAAQMRLDVARQVTQNYYQLVANMALVRASQRAMDVAVASVKLTEQLFAAGRSATLEVDRARAEVERQLQQLTQAQLQVQIVARALASATGQQPELAEPGVLDGALAPEAPLESFMLADAQLPGLAAAIGLRQVREQQANAQRFAWIPALALAATERLTNATGFSGGHRSYYSLMFNLTWNADLALPANVQEAEATAASARIAERRMRLAMRDAIFVGWHTVNATIVRSRSSREQCKVSTEAAQLAQDRYALGAATQLDLLQAQRDAFAADVSRIQADADLVNARAQLRLMAGRFPFDAAEKGPMP